MKKLASTLAGAASLLLMTGVPATGQELHTTYDQLKDEQRTFLIYIRDAENEYQNGVTRRGENNRLWQNNIMNSDLRLKVVFTLMDGNEKIPAHQSKIGALKKTFRETYWVNNFTTNYLALRNRAYELQNKLNPFIDQLDPNLRQWLKEQGNAIRSSATPQQQAAPAIDATSHDNLPPVTSGSKTGGRQDLGGGFAFDGSSNTVYGPDGKPIPGASLGPDGKIHLPKGYWIDPATGTIYGPDGKPISGAKVQDGKIVGPDGSTIADLGGGGPGTELKPGDKITINGQAASVTDIRELFGPDGKLKRRFLKAIYTDMKGGRLDSEVMLKNDVTDKGGGSFDVAQSEEDGTKISWALGIKETDRKASGQGFSATYQLVNAGTPADAEFEITAWEGPDGRKETSDSSFTVTFPKPGNYEVKTYGQTKKYGSKFTIGQTVNF